jgi:hypothetical protein
LLMLPEPAQRRLAIVAQLCKLPHEESEASGAT